MPFSEPQRIAGFAAEVAKGAAGWTGTIVMAALIHPSH